MTADPAPSPSDTASRHGDGLGRAAGPVRPDRLYVSVEESRIAVSALAHLGAIEGLSRSADPLAAIVLRTLAPTANRLAQDLRAAGHCIDASDRP